MKPHEETWRLEKLGSNKTPILDTDEDWSVPDGRSGKRSNPIANFEFGGLERAKLAAQAPKMARVFLKILKSNDYCPECCADIEARGHWPNCTLEAVLREAGVIPPRNLGKKE